MFAKRYKNKIGFTLTPKFGVTLHRKGGFTAPRGSEGLPEATTYRSKTAGFTLIEMLVVVAIVATLSGVVAVALRRTGPDARDAQRRADIKTLRNAFEVYYNRNGHYPRTTSAARSTGQLTYYLSNLPPPQPPLVPTYIAKVPVAPNNEGGSQTHYQYGWDNNGQDYLIGVDYENLGAMCAYRTSGAASIDPFVLNCPD